MRETQAHSEREQKNRVEPSIEEKNNSNGVKTVEPKKYDRFIDLFTIVDLGFNVVYSFFEFK